MRLVAPDQEPAPSRRKGNVDRNPDRDRLFPVEGRAEPGHPGHRQRRTVEFCVTGTPGQAQVPHDPLLINEDTDPGGSPYQALLKVHGIRSLKGALHLPLVEHFGPDRVNDLRRVRGVRFDPGLKPLRSAPGFGHRTRTHAASEAGHRQHTSQNRPHHQFCSSRGPISLQPGHCAGFAGPAASPGPCHPPHPMIISSPPFKRARFLP